MQINSKWTTWKWLKWKKGINLPKNFRFSVCSVLAARPTETYLFICKNKFSDWTDAFPKAFPFLLSHRACPCAVRVFTLIITWQSSVVFSDEIKTNQRNNKRSQRQSDGATWMCSENTLLSSLCVPFFDKSAICFGRSHTRTLEATASRATGKRTK